MSFQKIFRCTVCALLFAVAGCDDFRVRPPARAISTTEIVETILAPATATHPRQSEGDVVVLKNGTLLAAWSDFTGGRADEATGQISAATSRDGGRTWCAPFILQENIGKQNVMSVSFLRAQSGEILFFFLVKNSAADLKVFLRRSHDEGKTWSALVVVTPESGYFIMNNARTVQLKSGRILCPISFCEDIGKRNSHLQNIVYFSDDDGRSWKRSQGIVDVAKRGAMEPGLVELKNGNVLQIIRTQLGQIWFSISADGGNSWSPAAPFGIVAPESPSTITRLPDRGELLLIYNPSIAQGISGMNSRTPLACALSRDEGKTWSQPKLIEANADFTYAYTSVTFQKNRAVLTYYLARKGDDQLSLKFKSIPLDWFRQ